MLLPRIKNRRAYFPGNAGGADSRVCKVLNHGHQSDGRDEGGFLMEAQRFNRTETKSHHKCRQECRARHHGGIKCDEEWFLADAPT